MVPVRYLQGGEASFEPQLQNLLETIFSLGTRNQITVDWKTVFWSTVDEWVNLFRESDDLKGALKLMVG